MTLKSRVDLMIFSSVFSRRSAITLLSGAAVRDFTDMEKIRVDEHGKTVLLQGLKERKAEGSDELPSKMLKFCAHSVSPFLVVLFTKSLVTCSLPDD